MSGILRLESLTKGNTLKQGDLTLLEYRLFDADGDKLDIAGKSATVRLMKNDFTFIAYEKEGLTVAPDDTISFNVNKVLPGGLYHLEVIVDDKYIFPSRDDEGKFNVDLSTLGADVTIVEATGVEAVARKATVMMKRDEEFIDDLIENVISDTNVGNIEEYYNQFNEATTEFESLKTQAINSVTKSDKAIADSASAKSIAQGIDAKATNALNLSESADTLSKSVQDQFNQVVIDGDSSVESAQARVSASGVTKATLKQRLDDEHNEVATQLAQMMINVKTFGAKGDGITDDTNAFISALNEIADGSTLYIPNGHYRLTTWNGYSLTKDIKIVGQSKSHVLLEGSTSNDFMTIESNFSLEKVGLESWRTILTGTSGVNLDYFVFKDNIIKNNRTVINWSGAPISRIKEFYFEDCIIQDIEDYVLMGNFSYDLLKIARNKVKNITRYFVRVLGAGTPEDEMTMIAEHNDIEGISNGALSGNEGVARAFQIASVNIYLRFNKFKDINVNELSSANATVLYHGAIRLLVEGNTVIDSGISYGSGYLFDDKGERSELTHYINNEFISTEDYEGAKSVIGIRGENVLIQGNKFIGMLAPCIHIGHAVTRNIIIRENFFTNIRSQYAIRAIGGSHNITIDNNIFDGVTYVGNELSVPPGLNIMLFDSHATGTFSDVTVTNNIIKNVQSELSTSVVMFSNAVADFVGENYIISGNRVTGVDHLLYTRHAGSLDMVQVTNNFLMDIRQSVIRNDIGDRLTNLVVENNYGDFPPFVV